MLDAKEKIQQINFEFIENFLNKLIVETWEGIFHGEKYNKNEIWNIMYLYDNGYLKSSYQDDNIPVIYNASPRHPTITPVKHPFTNTIMYNKMSNATLDSTSQQKMLNYSNTRKYVRGYYFEFNEDSETIKKFKYYNPQITEIGIELLKFLNEKEMIKRKKMWENLLKAGADVIRFIAPLILQLLN